jgi:hypothetical protein
VSSPGPLERAGVLATLDPGVAPYVAALDAAGIETFESCQGGDGHAFPVPTIRFHGARGEGFRALAIALQNGPLPVASVRRYWDVNADGEPEGPHWEMTFWRSATDPAAPGSRTQSNGADSRSPQRGAMA